MTRDYGSEAVAMLGDTMLYAVIWKGRRDKYGNESSAVGPFISADQAGEWIEGKQREDFDDSYHEYIGELHGDDEPLSFNAWLEQRDLEPWMVDHFHVTMMESPVEDVPTWVPPAPASNRLRAAPPLPPGL